MYSIPSTATTSLRSGTAFSRVLTLTGARHFVLSSEHDRAQGSSLSALWDEQLDLQFGCLRYSFTNLKMYPYWAHIRWTWRSKWNGKVRTVPLIWMRKIDWHGSTLCLFRYRQEAYLYDNKIFVFGGGGLTGISYSLENVGLHSSMIR